MHCRCHSHGAEPTAGYGHAGARTSPIRSALPCAQLACGHLRTGQRTCPLPLDNPPSSGCPHDHSPGWPFKRGHNKNENSIRDETNTWLTTGENVVSPAGAIDADRPRVLREELRPCGHAGCQASRSNSLFTCGRRSSCGGSLRVAEVFVWRKSSSGAAGPPLPAPIPLGCTPLGSGRAGATGQTRVLNCLPNQGGGHEGQKEDCEKATLAGCVLVAHLGRQNARVPGASRGQTRGVSHAPRACTAALRRCAGARLAADQTRALAPVRAGTRVLWLAR